MRLSVRKLADGAYGTNLLRLSPSPDSLNLSDPQQVEALHDAYAAAGSEILRTNTFMLPGAALEGGRIALRAPRDREVWGCVGPKQEQRGKDTNALYLNHFRALRQAGITHLHLETFFSPESLEMALSCARSLDFSEVSVSLFLPPTTDTESTIESFLPVLLRHGIDHVSLNCVPPDSRLRAALLHLLGNEQVERLSVFPEAAGLPPRQWALRMAETLAGLPLYAVGGCCGTTPEHIRELGKFLK